MSGATLDLIADTSAVIGLLRRDARVEEKVEGKNFAITFVTSAEIFLGVLKARNQAAAQERCRQVLEDRQVLAGSERTPALYAYIYHKLEQRRQLIPVNDIWIAAIAIETGLPLLARDEHFSRVEGLAVIEC
jgi:predicted nucleic acid-binding protein